MSYDLSLFRFPAGADPFQEFVKLQEAQELEATPPSDSDREEMQRLADLLKARHPAFTQFQPKQPLPWIELTDEATSFQIAISPESASMNMAYFGENGGEMMRLAATCIAVLEQEAGWAAYDPQLNRLVRSGDLAGSLAAYRDLDRHLLELLRGALKKMVKPWWKFW